MSISAITSAGGIGALSSSGIGTLPPANEASKARFEGLMNTSHATNASASAAPTAATPSMELDMEKVLASSMPDSKASMPEFAAGLLRTQVKIAKVALTIEMINKTTNTLNQGIHSLTST